MGGAGVCFTGCIGVGGVEPPATVSVVFASGSGLDFTRSLGAASGTVEGDRMVTTLTGYSLDGAQGADGTITPDPNWTQQALEIDPGFSRQQFHVYTKIADAADEAGTSSYSWSWATGTVGTRGGVVSFTIPQASGTTLSAEVAHTARDIASYSVTPPDGDWLLAVFLYKDHRASGGDSAIPTVTTAGAVNLVNHAFTEQIGWHTVWAVPAGVASVAGTQSAVDEPSASLIVFGVTP